MYRAKSHTIDIATTSHEHLGQLHTFPVVPNSYSMCSPDGDQRHRVVVQSRRNASYLDTMLFRGLQRYFTSHETGHSVKGMRLHHITAGGPNERYREH